MRWIDKRKYVLHRRFFIACLILVCLLLLSLSDIYADTLIFKDGRFFQGRLVKRGEKEIVFEIHRFGAKVIAKFPADKVEKVVEGKYSPSTKPKPKPTYTGPTYFVIPVKGKIGLDVTEPVLRKCLNLARIAKPTVVILEIDSPGGSVQELVEILDILGKHEKLRLVAYVKRAASAAAILTFSCKEIVICKTGSIGGAVIYRRTPSGTPANIEEKMQSLYRARFRAVAEKAGHNPLLIEGMMRTDIELGIKIKNGRPTVVKGKGYRLLKPKGEILTLTGTEAVECGLALGLVESYSDIRRILGIASWRQSSLRCEGLFREWKKELSNVKRRFSNQVKKAIELIIEAEANNPDRFTYMISTYTGKFTSKSKKEWRKRSDLCTKNLIAAEKLLKNANLLARKYPRLGLPVSAAVTEVRRINRLRKEIEADRKRRSIPQNW